MNLTTVAVLAYQCIGCGHVEAPAAQAYSCDRCNGFELHVFEAQAEAIETIEAPPLPRSAARRLLAAIERDTSDAERFALTPLGEYGCDVELE